LVHRHALIVPSAAIAVVAPAHDAAWVTRLFSCSSSSVPAPFCFCCCCAVHGRVRSAAGLDARSDRRCAVLLDRARRPRLHVRHAAAVLQEVRPPGIRNLCLGASRALLLLLLLFRGRRLLRSRVPSRAAHRFVCRVSLYISVLSLSVRSTALQMQRIQSVTRSPIYSHFGEVRERAWVVLCSLSSFWLPPFDAFLLALALHARAPCDLLIVVSVWVHCPQSLIGTATIRAFNVAPRFQAENARRVNLNSQVGTLLSPIGSCAFCAFVAFLLAGPMLTLILWL
jgi:hypothetical protein